MPEPYWPKFWKKNAFTLVDAGKQNFLVKVSCRYCKRARLFETADLVETFGDMEVDHLAEKLRRCNGCKKTHTLQVGVLLRTESEAATLIRRRLVKRRPVWRDER
ncbi:MAG: hypothetical protein ABTQ31_05760 [Rhizobiaceae bacterium]